MTTGELVEYLPVEKADEEEMQQLMLLDRAAFDGLAVLAEAGMVTATALLLEQDMDFERYTTIGSWLGGLNRWCSWAIGDWVLYGEGSYGERFSQALKHTGLSEQTLLYRVSLSKAFPPEKRRWKLSPSVHFAVKNLPAKEQTYWLGRAERAGWGAAELRENMRKKRDETAPPLPLPDDAHEPDTSRVIEVCGKLLRSMSPAEDGQHYLVSNEVVAQLRGAMGQED